MLLPSLLVLLAAQTSLAKPTNCMLFCDEPQQQLQQMPVQQPYQPVHQPSGGYGKPYSVYNGFGRSTYALPSSRIENLNDVGFVQPGNYRPVSHLASMAQPEPQPHGLEALFHHSASSSSSSSSSSLGYIRSFPTINTGPVVQPAHESIRMPTGKLCLNEYNPCY